MCKYRKQLFTNMLFFKPVKVNDELEHSICLPFGHSDFKDACPEPVE